MGSKHQDRIADNFVILVLVSGIKFGFGQAADVPEFDLANLVKGCNHGIIGAEGEILRRLACMDLQASIFEVLLAVAFALVVGEVGGTCNAGPNDVN